MNNKIPDPRAMEKIMSDLSRSLESKNCKSKGELKEFLDQVVAGGQAPKVSPKNAVGFAQDIMYEAWDAESKKERIRLAKEALSVSADCADAYNLLAEEEAGSEEEEKELYQKGVEAGRRGLGEKAFKEYTGHFWGYTETRPYMRSRVGLMECLRILGDYDAAIGHAKEMLKLNTSDNQGIRYLLIAYYADLGRYDELAAFMNGDDFKDDCAAEWLYTKALLSFVQKGDCDVSNKEVKVAFEENAYVVEYLSGKKLIPSHLPNRITMGGEDEGYSYASRYLKAWQKIPGAIEWIMAKAGIRMFGKVGRNEPCPCGSEKKFKKCCGFE